MLPVPVSEAGIRALLRTAALDPRCFDVIGSTNTELKALAEAGAPAGTALVASSQTAGRGRMGRSFFSPPDTGLYLSLLLRPAVPAAEAVSLTARAAVAAAEAIEAVTGRKTGIKWVNDVLLDGGKVCGILAESASDGAGGLAWAVVGVGVNVKEPPGGFPPEVRNVAAALFPAQTPVGDLRERLAAELLERLWACCGDGADSEALFEAYRSRSAVTGRRVRLLPLSGGSAREALALDIGRDYSLRVRYDDGTEAFLNTGEVSLRL